MKIRNNFISNSSSSSFIVAGIHVMNLSDNQIKRISQLQHIPINGEREELLRLIRNKNAYDENNELQYCHTKLGIHYDPEWSTEETGIFGIGLGFSEKTVISISDKIHALNLMKQIAIENGIDPSQIKIYSFEVAD